ncbi:KGK domain-containing protein [Dapis sp. BLCC M172]|uniref:KGK domain-containing protein n=1 Tax=Dapis sp. BLCC M172 TaxID=2975281 RepID=UPI003CFA2F54
MTNTFEPLECDTDIFLMIGKDTFTVEWFKELAQTRLRDRLWQRYVYKDANCSQQIASWLFEQRLEIIENELGITFGNVKLIFPIEGINCKILKLGSKTRKPGKLRIQVMLKNASIQTMEFEFCYDEPPQPESPLDDIREREDYQQLLNNQ